MQADIEEGCHVFQEGNAFTLEALQHKVSPCLSTPPHSCSWQTGSSQPAGIALWQHIPSALPYSWTSYMATCGFLPEHGRGRASGIITSHVVSIYIMARFQA